MIGLWDFDGETFEPERDGSRLQKQLHAVRRYINDGAWHTLPEMSAETGYPEASISARLRDLRKAKFGGHTVERRYIADGLWEYRFEARATAARAGREGECVPHSTPSRPARAALVGDSQ